jgi:hypothetical protein
MKATLRLAAIAVMLALSACATSYHRYDITGGYSDTWLSPTIVRIYFAGNGYTHLNQAEDFAFLRAADLGRERGYPYFLVRREETNWHSYLYEYELVEKPRKSVTVEFLRRPRPGALDADYVDRSIRAKYRLRPWKAPR